MAQERKSAGYRRADTGEYVSKKYAATHPKTTVHETKPADKKGKK